MHFEENHYILSIHNSSLNVLVTLNRPPAIMKLRYNLKKTIKFMIITTRNCSLNLTNGLAMICAIIKIRSICRGQDRKFIPTHKGMYIQRDARIY